MIGMRHAKSGEFQFAPNAAPSRSGYGGLTVRSFCWLRAVGVDDRTIDSHIKRLRKKFKVVDDDFEMIETLYGVGYRFKE